MIRVFSPSDNTFDSNGDVVIKPLKCIVTNEDNGDYYIELSCGTEYNRWIQANNIIICPTPSGEQAFRISEIEKNKRRLEVKAWHVFYDSENYLIADSYAVNMNCEEALNHFNNATDTASPFAMHSDVSKITSYRCVRTSLAECIGTVLERWGGHLKRDNWDISIMQNTGNDYGVTIQYRKNLEELTATYNWDDVVTKLMPVGKDGILLEQRYVYAPIQYDIPYTKAISFEQDINQEDYPSEADYIRAVRADLLNQAKQYINTYCYPNVNYSLKGNPEKVADIGDKIEVKDERIGVDILTEVISYEYNAITGKYINLEFGNFGNTLSNLMSNISKETTNTVNMAVSEVTTETSRIYELLQSGYIVYRGYDLLVLDTLPASEAVNVLKISHSGVSLSETGVSGEYTSIYDLYYKRIRVGNKNSIDIYNNFDILIGSIDDRGINLADGSYLAIGDYTLTELLRQKQNVLTAGDGISINQNTISIAKYQSGATILDGNISTTCHVDSGTLTFEVDIDRPCDGLDIQDLTITVYDGNPVATSIILSGQTTYTVTIDRLTDLKYQISISSLSFADGGYVSYLNLLLKAL